MADSKKYNGSTWEHSLRKLTTATEAVENPLYSDGTAITSYTIKGNTIQSGTPSPNHPLDVNGVGKRTENLWNEDYTNILAAPTYVPIYVGDGEFTLSTTTPFSGGAANLFLLAGNVASGASTSANGVWNGQSRTVTAIDGYVTICYRNATAKPENFDTMLNLGSTAKPYEPYGYKIPISNGQQTTNIYLGSVQSTRQIKKYEFTGQEPEWRKSNAFPGSYFIPWSVLGGATRAAVICSHASTVSQGAEYVYGTCLSDNTNYNIMIMSSTSTLTEWTQYLTDQYNNNTPVTIWFVLATATTAAVNEPLMKIGDYADTVSNATSIPATEGANSITVDTTVQPSEFTATWTGWHDANVKEWDGSDWQ